MDEEQESLLCLCDDIILQILSYMDMKNRVKHARTSKRMADVVDQSLAGVRSLPEDWTFRDERGSRMRTLSKLKNLRRMDASSFSIDSEIVSVMVQNCQKLEHISGWSLDQVDDYISGLHAKGVPVRLKTISAYNCLQFCEPGSLSSVLQKSSAKLIIHADEFTVLMARDSTPVDFGPRVVHVKGWTSAYKASHHMLSNVTKLTGLHIESGDEMQRLLEMEKERKMGSCLPSSRP